MLAAMFIKGGIDVLRGPGARVQKADKLVGRLAEALPYIQDTEHLVKVDGAAKVALGTTLALGKFPRFSALGLIVSMVPTTVAGHPFWEEKDKAARAMQLTQFLKNMGLIGGLLLAAVDTEGKPSLAYRAKRAPKKAKRAARDAKLQAQVAAHDATSSVSNAVETVKDALPV